MRLMRSLLLGSAALSFLPMFSPEGLGGGATPFQSYDPSGANYVPENLVATLTAAGHTVLSEPPPAPETPVAQVRVAAVQEAPVMQGAALQTDVPTDADRITALEQRVAALEAGHDRVARAGAVLDWAEKVLTKYHNNPNDKPADGGNAGDIANGG